MSLFLLFVGILLSYFVVWIIALATWGIENLVMFPILWTLFVITALALNARFQWLVLT